MAEKYFKKIPGVLGGLGIDVTAEFLARVIDATGAEKEQENIPMIINHNPAVPDRTSAILYDTEDPLPSLKSSLEVLEKAGAGFIAIPCNTAHYYYDALQEHVSVPIIHMVREVALRILTLDKPAGCTGLMATTGTVRTGLYQKQFKSKGIDILLPDGDDQDRIMKNIMVIKSRRNTSAIRQEFIRDAKKLADRGARAIVVGCTDISLAIKDGDVHVPIIDSLSVLAEKTVQMARG